jgi:class 3 adenylate cyclase
MVGSLTEIALTPMLALACVLERAERGLRVVESQGERLRIEFGLAAGVALVPGLTALVGGLNTLLVHH